MLTGCLFRAVTAKLFGDASPGEIVSILNDGRCKLAMVAVAKEAGGKDKTLLFLAGGAGGASHVTWCPYEEGQLFLSYRMAPQFRFDPAASTLVSPRQVAVPNGASASRTYRRPVKGGWNGAER